MTGVACRFLRLGDLIESELFEVILANGNGSGIAPGPVVCGSSLLGRSFGIAPVLWAHFSVKFENPILVIFANFPRVKHSELFAA